jgi:hypothetical protein
MKMARDPVVRCDVEGWLARIIAVRREAKMRSLRGDRD